MFNGNQLQMGHVQWRTVQESEGTIPAVHCPCAPAKLRLRQSVQRKYRYTQCAVFDGSCRNNMCGAGDCHQLACAYGHTNRCILYYILNICIYIYIHPSIYLSSYRSIYLSIYLPIYLSIYIYNHIICVCECFLQVGGCNPPNISFVILTNHPKYSIT